MSLSTPTPHRKAGAEFLFKNRYKSTIPPLPFDPKSLKYPFPEDLLYKYRVSSLEKHSQYSLPTPEVQLNLIHMAVFETEPLNPGLPQRREKRTPYTVDPRDEALLVDPDSLGESSISMSGSRRRPEATFLRRAEFPDVDPSRPPTNVPYLSSSKGQASRESKVLALTDTSKEGQINVIQSTFTACASRANKYLKHPQAPNLTPVNILPILPDLRLWPSMYTHVTSEEPLVNMPIEQNALSKAVLRPRNAPEGGTLFSLYNKDPNEECPFFKYARAYSFTAKPSDPFTKVFFAEHKGKIVYYAPIQSKLTLTKYRETSSQCQLFPQLLSLEPTSPNIEQTEKRIRSITNLSIAPERAAQYLNSKNKRWHELETL